MSKTKIEWSDEVWNPTTGCTRVSSGCDHCYAVRHTIRLAGQFEEYQGLVNPGKKHFNGVVKTHEDRLQQPLHWRKPRKVFVNSMSDLFHEAVPFDFIDRVFAVMALTPQHRYQILTKRPERMAEYLEGAWERLLRVTPPGHRSELGRMELEGWPLPNVWLGTSVEDQEAADERIPHLLHCNAVVRFLSCEPLIGPVDLRRIVWEVAESSRSIHHDALSGAAQLLPERDIGFVVNGGPTVDWVIVGGESGPGARPMHPGWVRSLRNECQIAEVAFFFKQWGAWVPAPSFWNPKGSGDRNSHVFPDGRVMARLGKKEAGRELDGQTWEEFPDTAEVPA